MNKPHKHAELIKAWADGAEIEWRFKNSKEWKPTLSPGWAKEDGIEYRIKSQPELVPFTFEDAKGFVGKSVVKKDGGDLICITSVLANMSNPVGMGAGGWITYQGLLDRYTFLDGSPCGKYVNK